MKVLLVNGSPHKRGCTNRALEEIAKTLLEEGVESEILWLGKEPLGGCIACLGCRHSSRCIYNDILEQTGASTATISRVNRSLQYGADGYRLALDRLETSGLIQQKEEKDSNV